MITIVGRWAPKPGMEETCRPAAEFFADAVRRQPGCVSFIWAFDESRGELISVETFSSQESMEASDEMLEGIDWSVVGDVSEMIVPIESQCYGYVPRQAGVESGGETTRYYPRLSRSTETPGSEVG